MEFCLMFHVIFDFHKGLNIGTKCIFHMNQPSYSHFISDYCIVELHIYAFTKSIKKN